MFVRGQLTRQGGIDPHGLTFAVLDLETTGLHPGRGSRVCEVGIVRMRGDGVVLDEYSTLVNPELRITNEEYHGITNADVKGAPTFTQIAGDVLAYLRDAIVVSHKLDFEEGFLAAEFGRLGISLTGVPGLCSLVTSRVQLDRYGYRLPNVANLITGDWPSAVESAMGGSRALASTLSKLVTEAPQPLFWTGPPPVPLPTLPRSGIITPRAIGLRKGTDGWLATLTARLPYMAYPPQPRPDGLRDYRALLSHALADNRIVSEEAGQLAVVAARAGLTQTTAREVHEEFLAEARALAEADGIVTSAELRELRRAAQELATSHLISDLEEAAASARARSNGPLRGWRILPVGDSASVTSIVDLAAEHGATVAVNVTKTVRLVITDGTADHDPRIAKAVAAGIDILTPDQAQHVLDRQITDSSTALFASPEGQALADELAAERTAEPHPVGPEWHEFWRPRELNPAEYHAMFIERHQDWDEIHDDVRAEVHAAQKRGGCAGAAVLVGALALGVAELIRHLAG